jgi:hypothetical protein
LLTELCARNPRVHDNPRGVMRDFVVDRRERFALSAAGADMARCAPARLFSASAALFLFCDASLSGANVAVVICSVDL